MRTWLCICLLLCVGVGVAGRQSQAASDKVGVWSGTWAGGGGDGGGFEITIEAGKDGALTGKVAVTGEPTYNATFTSLSFDGPKMTAVYDFPLQEGIIVRLAGTFEAAKASGTWTAVVTSAGGDEVASGTFTVAKK